MKAHRGVDRDIKAAHQSGNISLNPAETQRNSKVAQPPLTAEVANVKFTEQKPS